MRRNSGGGADERRGRSGALWTAGFARPDSPAGASRWGLPLGLLRVRLVARPRPPRPRSVPVLYVAGLPRAPERE